MTEAKPRRRSPKKPSLPEAERTVEVAENTLSKMEGKEDAPTLKVEEAQPDPNARPNQVMPSMQPHTNIYAKKPRVGTPTLGRSPNYVTTVGLGKLKVTHANGTTDV